jgi:hypothetical protein
VPELIIKMRLRNTGFYYNIYEHIKMRLRNTGFYYNIYEHMCFLLGAGVSRSGGGRGGGGGGWNRPATPETSKRNPNPIFRSSSEIQYPDLIFSIYTH